MNIALYNLSSLVLLAEGSVRAAAVLSNILDDWLTWRQRNRFLRILPRGADCARFHVEPVPRQGPERETTFRSILWSKWRQAITKQQNEKRLAFQGYCEKRYSVVYNKRGSLLRIVTCTRCIVHVPKLLFLC